jgi:hypothetical protein
MEADIDQKKYVYERIKYDIDPDKKARRQTSMWLLTDTIITALSRRLDTSKTEVLHQAVTEMAKKYFPEVGEEAGEKSH